MILSVFSKTDSDTENNQSMWCQTHYDVADKNNNINFESLKSFYITSGIVYASHFIKTTKQN